MSTTLNDLLKGSLGEEDEVELHPDRIAGGRLDTLTVGVRLNGKRGLPAPAAGCPGDSRSETSKASSFVSGIPGTADTKRFLRWLADSLDTDTPTLNIEVVSDDGSTQNVQAAARRLGAQAFP